MKPKGKRIKVERGTNSDLLGPNVILMGSKRFDLDWIKFILGITLKPGETKEYVITEVE